MVGIPCHHIAWPRWCPTCRNLCDGVQVRLTREEGRLIGLGVLARDQAVGISGSVCGRCHLVAFPCDAVEEVYREHLGRHVQEQLGVRWPVLFTDRSLLVSPANPLPEN